MAYACESGFFCSNGHCEPKQCGTTPGYVDGLFWGGAALASVGLITAYLSYHAYDDTSTTEPTYRSLRTYNTLGWIGVVAGGGAMITSSMLRPALPPPKSNTAIVVGPGGVGVRLAF